MDVDRSLWRTYGCSMAAMLLHSCRGGISNTILWWLRKQVIVRCGSKKYKTHFQKDHFMRKHTNISYPKAWFEMSL